MTNRELHRTVDGNLVIATHFYQPFEVYGHVLRDGRLHFWRVKDEVFSGDALTQAEREAAVEIADSLIIDTDLQWGEDRG